MEQESLPFLAVLPARRAPTAGTEHIARAAADGSRVDAAGGFHDERDVYLRDSGLCEETVQRAHGVPS